jgi:hypothetical protein
LNSSKINVNNLFRNTLRSLLGAFPATDLEVATATLIKLLRDPVKVYDDCGLKGFLDENLESIPPKGGVHNVTLFAERA